MDAWKLVLSGGAIAIGGMVAGAQLFGSEPARAQQPSSYAYCFIGQQEPVDINNEGIVQMPNAARSILVPRGYDIIGGAGGQVSTVIFCRR